jgi:hypothetical protein
MCKDMKEGDSVDALTKEFIDYEIMMLPHLLQEEEDCLPLMRAYFTPAECAPKIQEIIGEGPKVRSNSDPSLPPLPVVFDQFSRTAVFCFHGRYLL